MKYLIDIRKAFVSYPSVDDEGGRKTILNDITFRAQQGEFIAVVGPSGCGKSTVLRLILGSQFPNQGVALVDGRQVARVTRDCGIVYQNYSLFPHLTVEENIAAGPILEHTNLLQWFVSKPILSAVRFVDQFLLGPGLDLTRNVFGFVQRYMLSPVLKLAGTALRFVDRNLLEPVRQTLGKLFRRKVVSAQNPASLQDVGTKAGETPASPGSSVAAASSPVGIAPPPGCSVANASAPAPLVVPECPTGYSRPKRLQRILESFSYFRVLKEARANARELLAQCGLDPVDHGKKYPYELSGGMRQRVAIAQALIMKPKILLMDEPFGALDQHTREGMQDFIHEQWERHGITIFFVTHDLEEACKLGTRLIGLSQFWTDENGRPGKGAKILIDKKIEGGAEQPSKFKDSDEFKQLVADITNRALTRSNPQRISAFELTHEDAFRPGEEQIVNV